MELGEIFIKIGESLKEEKPLELTCAKEGEPKTVSLESDKLEFMVSEEFIPYPACGYTSKSTGMKNGETNVKQHIGQKKNMEEAKAIPLVRLDE